MAGDSIPQSPAGRVTIAGAGPGDPELLTLKALRRLEAADAIVHDALISEEIVALFPATAETYDAGKRGGDPRSAHQEQINRLLVRLAREGKAVVRLKGGDPFVFGRGGEEALFLQAAGVPWEIVPAVSSVNGAAAGAGIPLTHRGASRVCTILEGHEAGLERIAWRPLVQQGGTWVFLMAKASAPEVARRLLRHGAAPELGLALVENASLPDQAVTVSTLAEVAAYGIAARTSGPGLLLVGPTVALAHELSSIPTQAETHVALVSHLPRLTA